jgi:hypothetical protein
MSRTADEVLPPVSAPTAGFILQLFLIPLTIVAIIVMVWLMFSWLAQMGNDPAELVDDLGRLNEASWQKALTLANLLRNPEHESLKQDHEVARRLAAILDKQLDDASMDDRRVKLRVFLCRALGEFHVDDGLPALIRAAGTEREVLELDVRRAAVEAIAVLAKSVGPDSLRGNAELRKVLANAAIARGDQPDQQTERGELRAAAAFALGIIGGDAALATLKNVLDDPYPNARYNAATGLARHGHIAAVPVIVEMLDPADEGATQGEASEAGKQWKRMLVLTNGIRAAELFVAQNPTADCRPLADALAALAGADVSPPITVAARGALKAMPATPP